MDDIDGFVLAGGASSRMGRAKANLVLNGETFARRAARALSAAAAPQRIAIVGDFDENDFDGLPIVRDEFRAAGGERKRAALVGLHAALKNSKANWAAITACDLPFASGELFLKLAALRDENFDAVVPLQPDARAQPLCALYRREGCLPAIETMLESDDWSLRNLLRRVATRFVRFDEIIDLPRADLFFFNVNTPEDYAEAQAILAKAE